MFQYEMFSIYIDDDQILVYRDIFFTWKVILLSLKIQSSNFVLGE